jgi:hypothetical protein
MTIKEIAEHIRDRSAWGWRKRRELNLKQRLVQAQILAEMRRAGMRGQVRFIGSPAISLESIEIDPTYWTSGAFEGNDIWNEDNVVFATTSDAATESVPYFRYGRAPRDDVMNCWPEASILLKILTKTVLCVRQGRRGFSAVWEDD